jgi:hypothetical protein
MVDFMDGGQAQGGLAEESGTGPFGTSPGDVLRTRVELFAELMKRTRAFDMCDCVIWTGGHTRRLLDTYGAIRIGHRINARGRREILTRRVHRVVWELMYGPTDLVIDHLCGNKGCVHPAHLEPVTRKENSRRYDRAWRVCVNGHPATGTDADYLTVQVADGYPVRLRRCIDCLDQTPVLKTPEVVVRGRV